MNPMLFFNHIVRNRIILPIPFGAELHDAWIYASRSVVAGGMLMLGGCISMSGIAPKATKTAPAALDAGQTMTHAEHIDWPNGQWWKSYRDPQLDALVERTISGSPQLRAAQARVALAEAYAQTTRAATQPVLSGDASLARERFTALQFIPPPWAGHTDWNNKATLTASYDLDLWGQKESSWKAALDQTQAVSIEVQQVKLELVTAEVRTYIQLALTHDLRDIAAQELEEAEERVAIARRSLRAGLGTQLELSEAETMLPQARMRITALDGRIGLLRNQLAALSGQGPGAGETLQRPSLHLDTGIGLPDSLSANLIGRRPDIVARRWYVEATRHDIDSAKATFYPNINLLAFIGFQALGFSQFLSSAAQIAGAGPAVSLPIFDGGRRRGELAASTAQYDIAVENYNATLVNALQDVSDQLVRLQSNREESTLALQALALAEKTHTLAESRYRAGLSDYQKVLETHSALLRQRATVAELQAARQDAHAGLMRALGGGTLEADGKVAEVAKP
jgi:NodT family efflux transporter outer membrane factor (OMF) lipoprotein